MVSIIQPAHIKLIYPIFLLNPLLNIPTTP